MTIGIFNLTQYFANALDVSEIALDILIGSTLFCMGITTPMT